MSEGGTDAGREEEGGQAGPEEDRPGSPASDGGSFTVKEERIGGGQERTAPTETSGRRKKLKSGKIKNIPILNDPLNVEETVSDTVTVEKVQSESEDSGGREKGDQNSDEYKFFCKLCHIGFLKETSYKYHFANNVELHKKMKKTTGQKRKCDDCGKSFVSDKLFRKHMYNDHKLDDPFYCKICNIILKNESAYKSHHSKLHLERRTKIFYCRECEDIFQCKLEHQVGHSTLV